MKKENQTAAVLAGVFLILYALPYFVSLLMDLSSGELWKSWTWLSIGRAVLMPLAGLFLILRKPKLAAGLMTAAVLAALIQDLPALSEYLKAEDGMISVQEFGDHLVQMPAYLGLMPLLLVLAELLLAVTLYVRGPGALILAVLAAASVIASIVLELQMFYYLTGHPMPLIFIIPLNFVISAISAGCWRLSLES